MIASSMNVMTFVVMARPEIKRVEELKGKRVAFLAAEGDPATVLPTMCTGFTDSNYLRAAAALVAVRAACRDGHAEVPVYDIAQDGRCGSQVEIMEPGHHDRVLAITSHLPHLIAYCIVGTVTGVDHARLAQDADHGGREAALGCTQDPRAPPQAS